MATAGIAIRLAPLKAGSTCWLRASGVYLPRWHPIRTASTKSAPTSAKDLADLAPRVWPRGRPASGVTVDFSDIRRGRIITTGQTVNGRRIMVQKRQAFAVFVGEQPVKKP